MVGVKVFQYLGLYGRARHSSLDAIACTRQIVYDITKTRLFKYIENFTSKN